jgi:glutamate/aspartate transport system substrate-binding protein
MPPRPHRSLSRLALAAMALLVAAGSAWSQPPASRQNRIEETKTLRIAHRLDAAPFSFVNDQQEPTGYTVDLCKLVARALEQRMNAALRIEWVPVTTQTRFTAVADGRADMECGSSTVSLSRMREVDFSSFIFVENTALAVMPASAIRGFDDLRGRKIAVITGTTNQRALARELERRRLTATVIQVANRDEGMTALETGLVDAFANDRYLLGGTARGKRFAMLPEDISIEPYAIVLPRGDWAFRLAVNTALAQIFRGGDILDVFTRWFGGVAARPNPLIGSVYLLGALPE